MRADIPEQTESILSVDKRIQDDQTRVHREQAINLFSVTCTTNRHTMLHQVFCEHPLEDGIVVRDHDIANN
jgi:hypothetical protein